MKISKMIKELQEIEKAYGDLDCWYAKDDEGNGYQKVSYEPSIAYIDKNEKYSVENTYSVEDLVEDDEDVTDYKMVAMCN